jgi:DNA-binding NtrC family response regulator
MDRNDRQRFAILVVEDDAANRDYLVEELAGEGFRVEAADNGRAAIERVKQGGIDLVVSDVRMPELDGLDMLRAIKSVDGSPHVVTITAFGSIETAKRALKLGAYDYITKPFELEELLVVIDKALDERGLRSEVARLRREVEKTYRFENIIGKSRSMHEVFELIKRLSASTASVLITGESGTGKELVARAIHYNSPRHGREFMAINCAAIPDTLLESELFGYKRGAFTDAHRDHDGLFMKAQGGTVFLDEIAELSPPLQAKLLRVLQEREIRPLGATRSERVDVRVIAATNRDLESRMREGLFREDLYYRLNVIQILLPPLRDRAEDILPLAEHFLEASARRAGKKVAGLAHVVVKALLAYGWPGNVRELENVVERAVALCDGDRIGLDDLPPQVRERKGADVLAGALARGLTLAEIEREYITRVLAAEGGNKTRAAQRLGLDRKTLYRKIEEYERSESGAAVGAERETAEPASAPTSPLAAGDPED